MEGTKKIFVSVDLEGIGGIVSAKQCGTEGGALYQEARRLMASEVNAVIEGINHGGALAVIGDAHGSMLNIPIELLRGDFLYCGGEDKALSMMGGLDESFSGIIFLGYHGRFGTERAVLDHTYSPSTVRETRINGVPVGEAEINAGIGGYFGVPVLMVCGDTATTAQLKPVFPKALMVETKESIGRFSAICKPPEKIRQYLYDGARKVAENPSAFETLYRYDGDIVMENDWSTAAMAEVQTYIPGVVRKGERTTAYTSKDYVELFKLYSVFRAMARSVSDSGYL